VKWAAVIPTADAHQLAALRHLGQVEACAHGGEVWLRGPDADEAVDLAVRRLSGARRFALADDGVLTPVGARTPTGRLPDGAWLALEQFVTPQAPTAGLPALTRARLPLTLVRSSRQRPANVLLTDTAAWLAYAATAPQVRLEPLTFAASADGRVIVRGTPLPPVRGMQMAAEGGIAVPCGWRVEPDLDADVIRAAAGSEASDLLILAPDAAASFIPGDGFVAASRSAARQTAEELDHG